MRLAASLLASFALFRIEMNTASKLAAKQEIE